MKKVKDFLWKEGMNISELVETFGNLGFQALELYEAKNVILKMKRDKAKVFLTFTSNMVTSGLRGFFAQLCHLGIPNILVTTSGSIEEDLIKSTGESFEISSFYVDDNALHERGENRVGNLTIRNEVKITFKNL